MRKMNCVVVLALMLLSVCVQESFAQKALISTEKKVENSYLETQAFKLQVARTQTFTGGILGGMGVGMLAGGIAVTMNNSKIPVDAETPDFSYNNGNGVGIGLMITGGIFGAAGAFLMKRGIDGLIKVKNKHGEVVSKIDLSQSGMGLALKF